MAAPSLGATSSDPRPPALLVRGDPPSEGCVTKPWGEFRWRSALAREPLASPSRPHNLDLIRNTRELGMGQGEKVHHT